VPSQSHAGAERRKYKDGIVPEV